MHIFSVVTDAMKAKQLETERDSWKLKADEADTLKKELLELKKQLKVHAHKVRALSYSVCVCVCVL